MRTRAGTIVISAIFLALCWLFIGFDHYVGDHDMGEDWNPFIKSSPSFIMLFEDPSRTGLEYDRFDTLSPERKARFIHYCKFRRGTSDPYACQKINDSKIL